MGLTLPVYLTNAQGAYAGTLGWLGAKPKSMASTRVP